VTVLQAVGAFRALFVAFILLSLAPTGARAAPYADVVMDARSGEILHATNAESRLHPASLTKMMTLYIAFEAVRMGEITLDTMVTISPKAAAEPPSKLGLRAGQQIQLRYLIRAAAVKSANDAATAIGEAIGGSEAAFARRMNRTAKALGMTRTTFKNAHGLTEEGHLSTARDMTILGRHLLYDYPQYYNIFSRRSADAGVAPVNNTNRRFLDAYEGADGIKTGYTRAAGFNLVASAERGRERIIATVFGGTSTANRNARMAELLDLGFSRAPNRVALNRPALPRYEGLPEEPAAEVAVAEGAVPAGTAAGKIIRVSGAVAASPRPRPRGGAPAAAEPPPELIAAIESDVAAALADAVAADGAPAEGAVEAVVAEAAEAAGAAVAELAAPEAVAAADPAPEDPAAVAGEALAALSASAPVAAPEAAPEATPETAPGTAPEAAAGEPVALALAEVPPARPRPRPAALLAASAEAPVEAEDPVGEIAVAGAAPTAVAPAPAMTLAIAGTAPAEPAAPAADEPVLLASVAPVAPVAPDPVLRPEPEAAEVVTRLSTSGGRHSGVSLGRFATRTEAEKVLISTALADSASFMGGLRRVVQRGGGFEANFMGMSAEQAALACRRLVARGAECTTIGE
jgi:D-alanyl-D-alanine carboxypeptidase